ncbi:hypothetical protein MAUB1S_02958 [Mycolicibacterium aubagnense]
MSVQTGPRSATLGSDLTQYEQRNRLRQAAQLYAAEDDRIRTCGELAPRRRRDDPNRDIDTGLRRDAHRILGTSYGEHYCERRWTCAVCASIEGKHRREEFCGYFTDWLAGGGSLAVLTQNPPMRRAIRSGHSGLTSGPDGEQYCRAKPGPRTKNDLGSVATSGRLKCWTPQQAAGTRTATWPC